MLVIWLAICLHLGWGLIALIEPNALYSTPTHVFRLVPTWFAPWLLIAIAGCAALATQMRAKLWVGLLLAPQQFVLMYSAFLTIQLIIAGKYADGVERSWAFIATDQLPILLLSIVHTVALLFSKHRNTLSWNKYRNG